VHLEHSRWVAVGSSVRGVSHERSGKPGQDAHHLRVEGEWLVATVADGAGSAPLAEVGAPIAARTAAGRAVTLLAAGVPADEAGWQRFCRTVLVHARAAVESEAAARQVPSRELASTLIVAVAGPDLVVAAQVGDGAAVCQDGDGQVAALTRPPRAEYVNETTFLVSPGALDRAQTVLQRKPVRRLALFSDGLQMLALRLSDGAAHPPFFQPMFEFIGGVCDGERAQRELEAFLHSPRIRDRADDDLTLVLAARRTGP
jgi:hypothetical protein